MSKKDYYELLGVDRNATQEDIKKAFRHMARKYHPDVNPDNKDAEDRFKEINEAFEVLKDPEKRSAYDQFGEAGIEGMGSEQSQGRGFGSFDDLFRDFGFGDIFNVFGGMGGGRRRRGGPEPGADLRYDLEITLKDSYDGFNTKIKVPRTEQCSECDGSGAKKGTDPEKCPECGGSGEIRHIRRMGFMQTVNITHCDRCNGKGTIISKPCTKCKGSGKESKIRTVEVKIPPGVEDGQYLRLAGQGEAGDNGGYPGDLYVIIKVKEHPVFERHGNDIFCKTTLSIIKAILGGTLSVPTIKGNVELKIPPGTQSHTVFRLKGQGMPDVRRRRKGDQLVKVVIDVPRKLSKEQTRLIEEFNKTLEDDKEKTEKGFFEKLKEKM